MSFETNWRLSLNNNVGINAYLSDPGGHPMDELYKQAMDIEAKANLCIDDVRAIKEQKREMADVINKIIIGIFNQSYGIIAEDLDKSIKASMKSMTSSSDLAPRCKMASLQWNDRDCISPIKTALIELGYITENNQRIAQILDAKIAVLDIYEGSIAQCIEEGQLALSELHNDSLAS